MSPATPCGCATLDCGKPIEAVDEDMEDEEVGQDPKKAGQAAKELAKAAKDAAKNADMVKAMTQNAGTQLRRRGKLV